MRTFTFVTGLIALLLVSSSLSQAADEPANIPRIDELQKEYEKLRASLFTSRARAQAVGAAMYSSKLQIFLKYGTPRFFHISRASVRLDGAPIFDDTAGTIGNDDLVRFDGFIAPGKHIVSVRVDTQSKDDTSFVSSSESTFVIDVPNHRFVVLRAVAEDAGDMGSSFGKNGKGGYKLHLDADVESTEMGKPDATKK